MVIEPATISDLPAIFALLDASELPQAGLPDHLATTIVARDLHEIVGCAALEVYDNAALLRSVAVAPAQRGTGLGQRLTRAALDLARGRGIDQVFLLTETAAEFFPRFGFQAIDRSAVPESVQQSIEFTSACPASALAMRAELGSV